MIWWIVFSIAVLISSVLIRRGYLKGSALNERLRELVDLTERELSLRDKRERDGWHEAYKNWDRERMAGKAT